MKNDMHLAFRTTQNFPLQVSIYDSVKYHLTGEILLITQLPAEWPKVRGRELVNPKNYDVKNEYQLAGHTVEHIHLHTGEQDITGKFIDRKYFFSDGVLNQCGDLEMILTPFAETGLKPMVRREWSWDYPSSLPFWYSQVPAELETYEGVEIYYPIEGYEELGIHKLLDLLAYSYKFKWMHGEKKFVAIKDEHEITKRIRKPWMQYLVQWKYGEAPGTEADLTKLVSFLMNKVELSDEEHEAVGAILSRSVTLDDLKRINERHEVLNTILAAYNDPFVLKQGVDIKEDPLFALTFE